MEIKELEQATKILQSIKILDNEIAEIEKIAMIVANSDTGSSIELKVVDYDKPAEATKEDNDEEVDDKDPFMGLGMFAYISRNHNSDNPKKEDNVHRINYDLSLNGTMQMLGVLLYEKQSKRTLLIKKLNKYGINI